MLISTLLLIKGSRVLFSLRSVAGTTVLLSVNIADDPLLLGFPQFGFEHSEIKAWTTASFLGLRAL